MMQDIML